MAVEKFSVSLDPELSRALREAAEEDDVSVSAWLAEAVRQRLRNHMLGLALDEIIAEQGWTWQELLDEAEEEAEEEDRAERAAWSEADKRSA
ncbi:MAG: hypothetical protein OEY70_00950 [Acidimicrobiia bacterium]|nr:hypothetical protein [Acidimicrobiia bacterium]